jgi:hypothetical protein
MKAMRIWLDQRQFEPEPFEYVISGSGTLVRVKLARDAEAAEFAEAFDGFVSRDCLSIGGTEENSGERSASHGL